MNTANFLQDFFFLRPYWLLMLIPVAAVLFAYGRRLQVTGRSAWEKTVDTHLLPYLTVRSANRKQARWPVAALAAGLVAAVLAAAGPTWKKIDLPAFTSGEPTVVVLSLAQSMNATDVSPNRMVRATHKLRDLLDQARGGDFGLIIYSDRPFVAAPLTSDTRVIEQMLPELSTNLMPVIGNRLNLAIDSARELLARVEAPSGRIVVIADDAGIDPAASTAAAEAARREGYEVSVLGVGTRAGATLQTASGQAIQTNNGQSSVTQLAADDLEQLADAGGGVFVTLAADNRDVDAILHDIDGTAMPALPTRTDFHADSWHDMGYWLLIIPVLLMPLAFRKNVLMALLPFGLVVGLCSPAEDAMAAGMDDLWQTPDQQGAQAYQEGNYDVAAGAFENPDWKASALYKSGQYDAAAQTFETLQSPAASYNLGNALAYAGKLEAALEAYDKALEQQPGDADTQFNRDLVASLLEQQQQEQEQQKQDQDQQQQDQDQQNESGQGESSSGEGKDQSKQDQKGEQGEQDQQASTSQGDGKNGQSESPDNKQGEGQGQNKSGGEEQNLAQSGEGDSGETPSPGGQQPSDVDGAGENEPVTSPEQQQAAADGKNAFQRAMDQVLQGNGSPQPTGTEPTENGEQASSGLSELDQAREQQLRAVPDDPSGLLRARIRQYYAQQYPYGGNS